jgi:HPt (histidine-containing phosphotransfer) domain-containing protein
MAGKQGAVAMGINHDGLMMVKASLCRNIEDVGRAAASLSPGQLAMQVDEIRRTARDHGLAALADVAHALETALARSGGSVMLAPYLDAMRDAAECEDADPAIISTYLAAISQRLYY